MHRQGLGIALAKHFLRDGAGQDVAEPLFPIPFLAIEPGYAQSTPVLNQVDRLHPEALAQTDAYMASLVHGPGEVVAVDLLVLAVVHQSPHGLSSHVRARRHHRRRQRRHHPSPNVLPPFSLANP